MPYDPMTGEWIADEELIDYTDPSLAPPNSRWNSGTGGWDTTAPGQSGYDPTWGGYSEPATPTNRSEPGMEWLSSTYGAQGWDWPVAPRGEPGSPIHDPGLPGPKTLPAGSDTPGSILNQPSGAGRIPGSTNYPLPGGKTSFSHPDFTPAPFDYPEWAAPEETAGNFVAPSWDAGEAPGYTPFVGPTSETFTTDPGYEFRAREMQRAIENAASARGLLATGGTLQDLMTARGSLASQEFGNIHNRQFQTHQANEAAKLNAYRTKFGAESEEYKRAVSDYNIKRATDQDRFGRTLTSYLTGYGRKADDWNREKDIYDTNLGKEAGAYGLNIDTGRLNLGRDDRRFGNLLSLFDISTRTLPTYSPTALPTY